MTGSSRRMCFEVKDALSAVKGGQTFTVVNQTKDIYFDVTPPQSREKELILKGGLLSHTRGSK